MGFGFTKQFIIQQGGGPVQYCLGTQECDRVKDLATVQRFLKSIKNRDALDLSTSQAFLRLTHFYKRTREVINPYFPNKLHKQELETYNKAA